MPNYTELLNSFYSGISHKGNALEETDEAIIIDDKRNFIIPENFNTTIGYEGDINSQIVTFKIPLQHEGHNLTACNAKLRWYHKALNIGDYSVLDRHETDISLRHWKVPSEIFSKAGNIEISITLYDEDESGKVRFSWNTASFSDLLVGATQANFELEEFTRENTLLINEKTKNIIAPSGYNFLVANYGEIGTGKLYFQIKSKPVFGIDLTEDESKIFLYYKTKNGIFETDVTSSKRILFYEESVTQFYWELPSCLINNTNEYISEFSIEIVLKSPTKTWRTNTFGTFQIGKGFSYDNSTTFPEEPAPCHYIISAASTTLPKKEISGTVKFQECSEDNPVFLRRNEIAIEYDVNGNPVAIKVGKRDYQSSFDAINLNNTDFMENGTKVLHFQCDI